MHDGGHDPVTGRTHEPVWPKIAAVCLAYRFDPAAFVAAQFSPQQIPPPSACHGDQAVARYREADARIDPHLRSCLKAMKRTLYIEASCLNQFSGLDVRTAVGQVLSDRTFPLSGVFRYVIAVQCGFTEIRSRFRSAALNNYLFHREAYDRNWPGIPAELSSDADGAAIFAVSEGRRFLVVGDV